MSIQNLFEMAKADRYTEDGCEQIKKAREQLAEDERYEIGQISKKTGLLKTANGWVEPPKGKRTQTEISEWEESAKKDAKAYNENMVVLQNEEGKTTIARESSPDIEKAEAHGYKKMSLVRPDGSVKSKAKREEALKQAEEHYGAKDSAPCLTGDCKIRLRKG